LTNQDIAYAQEPVHQTSVRDWQQPSTQHLVRSNHRGMSNTPWFWKMIQPLVQDYLTLQTEQLVWDLVVAVNSELLPHSRVRRHHVILIPASAATLLPVSNKGDVLVHQVEALFTEQIEKCIHYLFNSISFWFIFNFFFFF
jgi:hypothetical protein